MPFAQVYPHYVKKIKKKGRSVKELHEVITWLTGFSEAALKKHIKSETTFKDFFKQAKLHKNAKLITGTICGVKIEDIEITENIFAVLMGDNVELRRAFIENSSYLMDEIDT